MASSGVPSNWASRWAFAQMISPVIITPRCWHCRTQRDTASSSMGCWTSRCRFAFRLLGFIFSRLDRFRKILLIDACDSVLTRPNSTVAHFASAVWDKSGLSSFCLHICRRCPLVRRICDILYCSDITPTGKTRLKMYICGFPCVIIVSSDERSYGCVSYRWEGSKLARSLRLLFCSSSESFREDFGLYLREVGGWFGCPGPLFWSLNWLILLMYSTQKSISYNLC